MRRRKFLAGTALMSLYASIRPGSAATQVETPAVAPADELDVDAYFLDSGELAEGEQEAIEAYEQYRDGMAMGKQGIMPRGGRPQRAPNFRLLHWTGGIDTPGQWKSPLSVEPQMAIADVNRCELNAEILSFRVNSTDFPERKKEERGTLSVEFRGREGEDRMSWMFVQQFTAYQDGTTDLGMGHIAERDEVPQPISLKDPVMDMRIQLLRHGSGGGFLRKVLKLAGAITGLSHKRGADRLMDTANLLRDATPAMRIPRLPREGVALGQALLGGVTNQRPLWASGYNSFWLTKDGGRIKIKPGIWVAIDEDQAMDMSELKVADLAGQVALTRGDEREPIDANYLILDFKIAGA